MPSTLQRLPPYYPRVSRADGSLLIEQRGSLPTLTIGAVMMLAASLPFALAFLTTSPLIPVPRWIGLTVFYLGLVILLVSFRRDRWQISLDGTASRTTRLFGLTLASRTEFGCEIVTAPIHIARRWPAPDYTAFGAFVFSRSTGSRTCVAIDRDRAAIERWVARLDWPVRHEHEQVGGLS